MNALQPKIIFGVTAVVALFIVTSLAQEMNRRIAVQREVLRLEHEADNMHKSLIELENLNQYFRTDDYQDRVAREKLNYNAPGEKVVVITESTDKGSALKSSENESELISIPERWWRLFFVDNSSVTSNTDYE